MAGPKIPAPAAFAISAALHAGALLALVRVPAPVRPAPDLVEVEIIPTVPAEPSPPAPPTAPPPAPRPPVTRPTPAPPARAAPPPRADAPPAPPPPNAAPPADAPPPEQAPVRIGVSMSSDAAGGVAAPAGNTLVGEMPRTAPDPSEVKPYRSDRYVAPTEVTVLPRLVGPCRPPSDEYPEAARRLGIEGRVVLVVTVDETGRITEARVVEDPGHGLGAAAASTVRRHCRFEPARKGGEPVATSVRFPVTFALP